MPVASPDRPLVSESRPAAALPANSGSGPGPDILDDTAAPPTAMRRVRAGLARFRIGVPPTRKAEKSPSSQSCCCGQYFSGHDPTPISRSACRYCPARALAGHGTLDIIEPMREGGDSHADFRIIAEGFYQDNGRCRRRDLWPRRSCQSPGLQASGSEETDAGRRSVSRPPEGERNLRQLSVFRIPKSCVLVEGEISATGWCPIYTTFSPLDRGAHT